MNHAPLPPSWITGSPLLVQAYSLAEAAHRDQLRPSDNWPFLYHVTEVATFLAEADADKLLIAVGLLHDSVERGTLTESSLRREMGREITSLVLALSEDETIQDFEERKRALREQVSAAGPAAITVFAADKLSDIIGLRRGLENVGPRAVERRITTSLASMIDHYRASVDIVGLERPRLFLVPPLRAQLRQLFTEVPSELERKPTLAA
jgi:(p)ppGpp synthase/HD superfamily hydrolase